MTDVRFYEINNDFEGLRIDSWMKRKFPGLNYPRIQIFLRTGQIRIDGRRAKPGLRLKTGQIVRVPPIFEKQKEVPKNSPLIKSKDIQLIQKSVLYCDDNYLVLNKPFGLPVQGGSKVKLNLDSLLTYLKFDKIEKPHLVHRLDKHTSGILVLARNKETAKFLSENFYLKKIRKLYWAICSGVPNQTKGVIETKIGSLIQNNRELSSVKEEDGKYAKTRYQLLDKTGSNVALVALEPITGRKHQLRVHLAKVLNTPVLGDGKYGGKKAFIPNKNIKNSLFLHARAIRIPLKTSGYLEVSAPIPQHFKLACIDLNLEIVSSFSEFIDPKL